MITFTAPVDGYYQISGKIYKSKPTGKMIEIKNPEMKWYTFWLPETVMVPEYITTEEYVPGTEVRFLKAGESVVGPGIRL